MTSRNTLAALALITVSAASPAAVADDAAMNCDRCVDGTYTGLQLIGSLQQDGAGSETLQPIGFLATMADGSVELADLGIDFTDSAVAFEWAVQPADASASMAAAESVLSSRGAVVVVSLMGQDGYDELMGQDGAEFLMGQDGTNWLIGDNGLIGENDTDWLIGDNGAINADFLMGQDGLIGNNGTVAVQPLGVLEGDDLQPLAVDVQDAQGVVFTPLSGRGSRAAMVELGTVFADADGYLNVDATSQVEVYGDGSIEVDVSTAACSGRGCESTSSSRDDLYEAYYSSRGR